MKKKKVLFTLFLSTMFLGVLSGCGDIRGEEVSIGGGEIEITEPVDPQYTQPSSFSFKYSKSGDEEWVGIQYLYYAQDEVINIAPQYGGYDVKYYLTFTHDAPNTTAKKIIFPDTMTWIDGEVFSNFQALEEIYISKSIEDLSPIAFCNSTIKKITVDPESEYFEVKNDALYSKKNNHFVHYTNNSDITQYTVYQATDVEDFAFINTSLTSVVFSEGVERISSYALRENDKLTSITLPSTFKGIVSSYGYDGGNVVRDPETKKLLVEGDPGYSYLMTKSGIEKIKTYNPNLTTIYCHADFDYDFSDLGIEFIKL